MENRDTSYRPGWLESKEFKFIVGQERREFMIPSELVAKQSRPLRALITNGMKESLEGAVAWPQIETETFKMFAEFLYTGDFHAPGFLSLELNPHFREPDATVDFVNIADDRVIQEVWILFQTLEKYKFHQLVTIYKVMPDLTDVSIVDDGCIAIAKVYILAHYYDISYLMDVCRGKMYSLMSLHPGGEGVLICCDYAWLSLVPKG